MFDGNLRQQKAAQRMMNNQESMTSDFYRLRKNRLKRRKQGDLNRQLFQLRNF